MTDEFLVSPQIVTTVPDPTTLTNQLVSRAISSLRELFEARFEGNENLYLERFRAVMDRFELIDKQATKTASDVKTAMDAAFAAAGAAAQKQEAAFTKQIDQLTSNVQLIAKASDDKLTDLKDRIVAMEGRSSISDPNTTAALRDQAQTIAVLKQSNDQGSGAYRQRTDSTTWIFSAIAASVAIAALAMEMLRTAH
jgi:hypothetical protein